MLGTGMVSTAKVLVVFGPAMELAVTAPGLP
jgi:hypothetical protein